MTKLPSHYFGTNSDLLKLTQCAKLQKVMFRDSILGTENNRKKQVNWIV